MIGGESVTVGGYSVNKGKAEEFEVFLMFVAPAEPTDDEIKAALKCMTRALQWPTEKRHSWQFVMRTLDMKPYVTLVDKLLVRAGTKHGMRLYRVFTDDFLTLTFWEPR